MTNNASCLLPSGVARWRIVNSFDCTPFCEFFHKASDGTAWLNIKIGAKNHDDYCHVSERAVEYFLKHNGLVEGLEPLDTGSFSLSVARFACADPHNGWKTLGCRTPSLACPSNHGFSIPTLNATFAAATRSDRLSHHWNPPESSPSTKLIEQLIKEVMVLHLLPQSSTVGEEKEESRYGSIRTKFTAPLAAGRTQNSGHDTPPCSLVIYANTKAPALNCFFSSS